MKRIIICTGLLILFVPLYFAVLMSDFRAVSWQSPTAQGYRDAFAVNQQLRAITHLDLNGYSGPEDITVDETGELYVSTAQGYILKFNRGNNQFEPFAMTGGHPLGLRFDSEGELIVADADLGLLKVNRKGDVEVLVNEFRGERLGFVDALVIDDKGIIYFSDASQKFPSRQFGGPDRASKIDILEHGGNGRVFAFDPSTNLLSLIASGLQFANGVALSPDQKSLLVVETGAYRIVKIALSGKEMGAKRILIDNLPGFPDNIVAHPDQGYWVGLTAPRSSAVDRLSSLPLIRNAINQLPSYLQPEAELYGHVFRMDESGEVIESLQDPTGGYAMTTGALQLNNTLLITSLTENSVAVRQLPSHPKGE